MTGLEKIVKQIQDEARAAADGVIAAANAEAAAIAEQAQRESKAKCEAIAAQSKQDVASQLAAAQSAAELAKRRAVLAAKQEMISGVITDAEQEIYSMPDAGYFDLILKMVKKYSLPQSGEILFSKKDLARIPADFDAALAKAANGALTVSKETREIAGGFVLAYGGIEENCSIEALFYAAHEQLQDKIQEILFA